jgi:hypothetical protein
MHFEKLTKGTHLGGFPPLNNVHAHSDFKKNTEPPGHKFSLKGQSIERNLISIKSFLVL